MASLWSCFKRQKDNCQRKPSRKFRGRTGSGTEINEKNGVITFSWAAGKITVVPDARIPLTPLQCYTIIRNWRGTSIKIAYTAITILARLFQKNPVFCIDHATTEENGAVTLENRVFENHAISMTQVFDEAIRSIGDPDRFFQIIKEYASIHATKPNFKPDYFEAIEEPFLCAVQITLEDQYSETIDIAYKAAIHVIIDALVEECDAAMDEDNND